MTAFPQTESFLERLLKLGRRKPKVAFDPGTQARSTERPQGPQMKQPTYADVDATPKKLLEVKQRDGRMNRYPPPDKWDDWVEWDSKAWPKKVPRRYTLVPTICFNCESACGLLAYVDKETFEIRKFEGNPAHPGSRGRNCAKGPATHNQTYDPERILYPLKRVGERGEGKWKRITWDDAVSEIAEKMRASRAKRLDGIMYHVGRPGEDHYANRAIKSWGWTATTATPTSAAPRRAPATTSGARATGRARTTPTPRPSCWSARTWRAGTTSTRTPSASWRARRRAGSSSCSTRG